jgi:catechol 2,3-dioxygenase-like lactoylglutathione lyase family enzyme
MRTGKLSQKLVPALLVKDMSETLAFYRKLGFGLAGCQPDEQHACWAEVVRDGVALQFHTEPVCGTPQEPVCSGTFYFYPESIDALIEELGGSVEFTWGPEVMEYGMREFGVKDPNGYYLAFAEPA